MIGEPVGLAVLDKPAGMTSHDVVAAVRRTLHLKRVGHAGTLDPPATGLLLVGVGRATRLLQFLQGTDKAYEGTLRLGSTTSTLDATGEVTGTFDMSTVSDAQVLAAAAALTGELDQLPPMVSAVHVGGRRLHELAREGLEVERPTRRVRVERFDVERDDGETWRFEVVCSTGTYVRTLVDDLGRALGGGAHLATLRRIRIGRFTLDDAVTLEAFVAVGSTAVLRPPRTMVEHLGVVVVPPVDVVALVQGRRVHATSPAPSPGPIAVCGEDGELVCVATWDSDGVLRPEVVLAAGASSDDG